MPRRSAVLILAVVALAGCGGHDTSTGATAASSARATTASSRAAALPARARRTVLRVTDRATLPAAVQLPGLADRGRDVVAIGGLDAADTSVADVVRVAPGRPRRLGTLPVPTHDIGTAAVGGTAYGFGGGQAAAPTDAIVAAGPGSRIRVAGRLPVALSDSAAATLGRTVYVVGGYTTTTPLRSVLAYRPGARAARVVAELPHAVRYAAVAAVGARILVAGGTDGTTARREILSIDPARERVRVVGRLPHALAHAAGVALGGTFYVLGGRGDALDGQTAAILAIDPRSGRVRHAGRLPVALSDLAAVAHDGRVLVVGGRDDRGRVHDERWTLRPEQVSRPARSATASGIPPLLDPHNVYAAEAPGRLAHAAAAVPARLYVPNSGSDTVDVIDQRTARIVGHFAVGRQPQHVVPSYDLRTLWVTNDLGNSLTPIDPRTGRPGRPVPVLDPYNMYFTADGRRAIVVAEAHRELDFRQPHSMRLMRRLPVPGCPGVDHMDYTADGRRALVSCEFGGRMIVVDLVRERVLKTIVLKTGAMPQDVKLSPDGRTFYVADMASNGVWLIDARRMQRIRFQPTGRGAHGLYPSRDARTLYVSNRGEGTISLISFRTRRPYRKWRLPGGGSPDMGGLSADGRVLWLTGRYNAEVYGISTQTGRLLHRIHVGNGPHGMAVWPQPGRYSIGHTGILR